MGRPEAHARYAVAVADARRRLERAVAAPMKALLSAAARIRTTHGIRPSSVYPVIRQMHYQGDLSDPVVENALRAYDDAADPVYRRYAIETAEAFEEYVSELSGDGNTKQGEIEP